MQHPGFFHRAGPFALRDIAEKVGAVLTRDDDGSRMIGDVQSLRNAGPDHLAFFDNRKYAGQLGYDPGRRLHPGQRQRQARAQHHGDADDRHALQRVRSGAAPVLHGRPAQQGGRQRRRRTRHARASDRSDRRGRHHRAGCRRRPGSRDRCRDDDCGRRRGRLQGGGGQRLLHRRRRDAHACHRRQRRHHPPRRAHRPGWVRVRDGRQGPREGAADRPRDHWRRRRDRRQLHRRPGRRRTRSSARAPRSTTSCRSPTTSSSAAIA